MEKLMNISEMRSIIAGTLRGIKSRRVKPPEAKAVIGLSGQLMDSYRLEVEMVKLTGGKLSEPVSFLPAPKKNGKK